MCFILSVEKLEHERLIEELNSNHEMSMITSYDNNNEFVITRSHRQSEFYVNRNSKSFGN